jgi:tRNA(fMet)-specific endonuclease VapC
VTGDLILDTSAVVAHLRGKPEATAHLRRALAEDRTLYLPLTAWGELLYGAYHGDRETRELADLEEFARVTVRLLPNERTAEAYARAKQALVSIGQMIPENDLWIAAYALEHALQDWTKAP